jgi:Xaa-Pro aminopeptidase
VHHNFGIYYLNILQEINFNVELMDDIITIEKAQKNDVEIASIKKAHMRDGAYLVKLYCDIYKNPSKYNEVSIDKKLTEIKSHDPLYLGSSFPSIVGINSNGAIVHYRANAMARGEKKLSDVNLIFHCFLVGVIAILIQKMKDRNLMVKGIIYFEGILGTKKG